MFKGMTHTMQYRRFNGFFLAYVSVNTAHEILRDPLGSSLGNLNNVPLSFTDPLFFENPVILHRIDRSQVLIIDEQKHGSVRSHELAHAFPGGNDRHPLSSGIIIEVGHRALKDVHGRCAIEIFPNEFANWPWRFIAVQIGKHSDSADERETEKQTNKTGHKKAHSFLRQE